MLHFTLFWKKGIQSQQKRQKIPGKKLWKPGKIMEESWNFVGQPQWEPWVCYCCFLGWFVDQHIMSSFVLHKFRMRSVWMCFVMSFNISYQKRMLPRTFCGYGTLCWNSPLWGTNCSQCRNGTLLLLFEVRVHVGARAKAPHKWTCDLNWEYLETVGNAPRNLSPCRTFGWELRFGVSGHLVHPWLVGALNMMMPTWHFSGGLVITGRPGQ